MGNHRGRYENGDLRLPRGSRAKIRKEKLLPMTADIEAAATAGRQQNDLAPPLAEAQTQSPRELCREETSMVIPKGLERVYESQTLKGKPTCSKNGAGLK